MSERDSAAAAGSTGDGVARRISERRPERTLATLPTRTAVIGGLGIVGIVGCVIVVAVFTGLSMTIGRHASLRDTTSIFTFGLIAQLIAYVPVCLWTLWIVRRRTSLESIGFRPLERDDVKPLLVGTAVLIATTYGFTALVRSLFRAPALPHAVAQHPNPILLIGLTILAVAFAPFSEELVFRGLLLNALRRKLGLGISVTISAVAFSLVHLEPAMVVPLALAGVVLGLLYERTGSIVVPMIAHAALNAVAVVQTLVLDLTHHP